MAQPATPARNTPCLTLSGSAAAYKAGGLEFTINPKAALFRHNSLIGIGMGVSSRVTEEWSLAADYTPLVAGDNTRDTADGSMIRRALYGVSVRYSGLKGGMTVDLGWTNATGGTTGAALTLGEAKPLREVG